MADTSYSSDQAGSSLTVDPFGGVWVRGKTSRSGRVGYRVSAESSPPVGYVTADGYTIIASRRAEGRTGVTEYLLSKYFNGFQIAEKIVPKAELRALDPQPAQREGTEELGKHRDALIESLRDKGKSIHSVEAVTNDVIGDRVPVLVSGASKFGQYPASPEAVEGEIRALLGDLDPTKTVLITGGTDLGVEKIVHEVARERGFKVVGFIQEGAIPGEINLVNDVVIAGARNQWSDPLLAALNVIASSNGVALVVGGGGVVKEGINAAEQLGVNYFLMRRGAGVEGGGASGEMAAAKPDRAFRTAREFRQGVEAVHPSVFRPGLSPAQGTQPKRIGFYAGSFNPPHRGHKAVLDRLAAEHQLDVVYVVPDKVTAYKPGMETLDHRKAMIQALFGDDPRIQVLSPEMEQQLGRGELWDLARVVRGQHPGGELFNIMGSDTFEWYRGLSPEHRSGQMTLVVNDRGDGVEFPDTLDGQAVQPVRNLDQGQSSTQVRQELGEGKQPNDIPKSVWDYIQENKLYEKPSDQAVEGTTVAEDVGAAKRTAALETSTEGPEVEKTSGTAMGFQRDGTSGERQQEGEEPAVSNENVLNGLRDRDPSVVGQTAVILARAVRTRPELATTEVLQILRQNLNHLDPKVVSVTQIALERVQRVYEDAFIKKLEQSPRDDLLIEGLNHENASIAAQTAVVLAREGVSKPWLITSQVVECLLKNLRHSNSDVVRLTRTALERILRNKARLRPDVDFVEIENQLSTEPSATSAMANPTFLVGARGDQGHAKVIPHPQGQWLVKIIPEEPGVITLVNLAPKENGFPKEVKVVSQGEHSLEDGRLVHYLPFGGGGSIKGQLEAQARVKKAAFQVNSDDLENVMRNSPVFPRFSAREAATRGQVAYHLMREAKRLGFEPQNETEAFVFWEEVAKRHGHESLEHYFMLKLGYPASSFLPPEMRSHQVKGGEALEAGEGKRREKFVGARSAELYPGVEKSGLAPEDAEQISRYIADYEYFHPEWRGHLEAADFHKVRMNNGEYYHEFKPAEPKARRLRELSRTQRADVFPELDIGPHRSEQENISTLRAFLEKYREAEKIYYDGGEEQMHCGSASALVNHLLTMKGFEAFAIGIHRYTSYQGRAAEALYGKTLQKLSQESGLNSPYETKKLLRSIDEGISRADFLALAEELEKTDEQMGRFFDAYARLSTQERQAVDQEGGWGHHITAVKIGEKYYLIDINQQQFGPKYDDLVLIPEEQAAENGIILEAPLSEVHQQQAFSNQIEFLGVYDDAKQAVVREYMIMQGTLPKEKSAPAAEERGDLPGLSAPDLGGAEDVGTGQEGAPGAEVAQREGSAGTATPRFEEIKFDISQVASRIGQQFPSLDPDIVNRLTKVRHVLFGDPLKDLKDQKKQALEQTLADLGEKAKVVREILLSEEVQSKLAGIKNPKVRDQLGLVILLRAGDAALGKRTYTKEAACQDIDRVLSGTSIVASNTLEIRERFGVVSGTGGRAKAAPELVTRTPQQQNAWEEAVGIVEQLGTKEKERNWADVDELASLTSKLDPLNRRLIALKLEQRLKSKHPELRRAAVEALAMVISYLYPQDRLDRVLKIEKCLTDNNLMVRQTALGALAESTPHLDPQHRLDRVLKIEEFLTDEDSLKRETAVFALMALVPHLGSRDRLARVLKIEVCLTDDNWQVRIAVLRAIAGSTPFLDPRDRAARARQIEEGLQDENASVRVVAAEAVSDITLHLKNRFDTHKDRKAFAQAVVEAGKSRLVGLSRAYVQAAKDYLAHGENPPADANLSFLSAALNDYSYTLGGGKWGEMAFLPEGKTYSYRDFQAWTVEDVKGGEITLKGENGEVIMVKGLGKDPTTPPFDKGDRVALIPRIAGGSPGPEAPAASKPLAAGVVQKLEAMGFKLEADQVQAVEEITQVAGEMGVIDLLVNLFIKGAPPVSSKARLEAMRAKAAETADPAEKRNIFLQGILQRETDIPPEANGSAQVVDFNTLKAESDRVAAALEVLGQEAWADEALRPIQADVLMVDNNFQRKEKYLRVDDHHGAYGQEKNSTEQMLDRFEGALKKIGCKDMKNPTPVEIDAAIRELNIREVCTDNLADGGWCVWIAQNQAMILADPLLRQLIREATHFEDFNAFGNAYNRKDHAVTLQAALFRRYGQILGPAPSDRFSPEQAQDILARATQDITALLDDPMLVEKVAGEFWAEVDLAKEVAKRVAMHEVTLDGKRVVAFYDMAKVVEIPGPDGRPVKMKMQDFTVFAQWLAVPELDRAAPADKKLPLQVTMAPMGTVTGKDGTAIPRRLPFVAIPNGVKLPSGKNLLTVLNAMNELEAKRSEELGIHPANFWDGKDIVIFPKPAGGGTILSPEEIASVLMRPEFGLFQKSEEAETGPPSSRPPSRAIPSGAQPLAAAARRGPGAEEVPVEVTPCQVLGDRAMAEIRNAIVDPKLNPQYDKNNPPNLKDIFEISCEGIAQLTEKISEIAAKIPQSEIPKTLNFIAHLKGPTVNKITLYELKLLPARPPALTANSALFTFDYVVQKGPGGEPIGVKVSWIKAGEDPNVTKQKIEKWEKELQELSTGPDVSPGRLEKVKAWLQQAKKRLEVNKEFRSKVVGPVMDGLLKYAAVEYPGLPLETRGDNMISTGLAGMKLDDTHFIKITDPKKYPVDQTPDPEFIDAMEQAKVLTENQATEIRRMGARADNIKIHNQLVQCIQDNFKDYNQKNPSAGAGNEVSFAFRLLMRNEKAKALIKKNNNRGQLWVEGTIPGKAPLKAAAAAGPQPELTMGEVKPQLGEVYKQDSDGTWGPAQTIPDPFSMLIERGQEIAVSRNPDTQELVVGDAPGTTLLFRVKRLRSGFSLEPLVRGIGIDKGNALWLGSSQQLRAGSLTVEGPGFRIILTVPPTA